MSMTSAFAFQGSMWHVSSPAARQSKAFEAQWYVGARFKSSVLGQGSVASPRMPTAAGVGISRNAWGLSVKQLRKSKIIEGPQTLARKMPATLEARKLYMFCHFKKSRWPILCNALKSFMSNFQPDYDNPFNTSRFQVCLYIIPYITPASISFSIFFSI